MQLQTPERMRITFPSWRGLAPIPAPAQTTHTRAALHEMDRACMRSIDADDMRDTWRPSVPARPARPVQLTLF